MRLNLFQGGRVSLCYPPGITLPLYEPSPNIPVAPCKKNSLVYKAWGHLGKQHKKSEVLSWTPSLWMLWQGPFKTLLASDVPEHVRRGMRSARNGRDWEDARQLLCVRWSVFPGTNGALRWQMERWSCSWAARAVAVLRSGWMAASAVLRIIKMDLLSAHGRTLSVDRYKLFHVTFEFSYKLIL